MGDITLTTLEPLVAVTVEGEQVTIDQTIQNVTVTPATLTAYSAVTTASTAVGVAKASAGNLYELTCSNATATAGVIKLYNKATAATVGTDVPILTIPLAAGQTVSMEFGAGKRFSTGIAVAATALVAATDTTVPVAGIQISGSYL